MAIANRFLEQPSRSTPDGAQLVVAHNQGLSMTRSQAGIRHRVRHAYPGQYLDMRLVAYRGTKGGVGRSGFHIQPAIFGYVTIGITG